MTLAADQSNQEKSTEHGSIFVVQWLSSIEGLFS